MPVQKAKLDGTLFYHTAGNLFKKKRCCPKVDGCLANRDAAGVLKPAFIITLGGGKPKRMIWSRKIAGG